MTIARFEVFTKVVDLGSFTKAAEELNMTQSAVSHAIASLETEWGTKLLIRDRRKGLLLTEIGQNTLVHIREILNRMEKINQELALAANLERGTIRTGTFASASSCLLPKILAKFQKKHPKIAFSFFEGSYEEIMEWLDTGVIDVGFIVQSEADLPYYTVPLTRDEMVVGFSPNHKLHKQPLIGIDDIKNEPFIMPKGMYQQHVEDIFRQAKASPCTRFEVHDCNTIANMVKEGLGITIGPELFLKTQAEIEIGYLELSSWRYIALACPSLSEASPAVKAFLHVAKQEFSVNK
ncbi:DNA-binding transcriptional regulator, LysR family [Evansella caseinilytica]|uniref:DNA-binding transcriptional regulator, LysR family n=1 Tax=Evansella caseinilytica TaxID=1503961 RepID=A0A1H3Q3J1_9BACI|nr:LysR family transcriptional regulator [Evansella caseinilytica]SDZ08064.1 DNA-binding transcriptional regulator, LysR family [Evansella caseinilytica]